MTKLPKNKKELDKLKWKTVGIVFDAIIRQMKKRKMTTLPIEYLKLCSKKNKEKVSKL